MSNEPDGSVETCRNEGSLQLSLAFDEDYVDFECLAEDEYLARLHFYMECMQPVLREFMKSRFTEVALYGTRMVVAESGILRSEHNWKFFFRMYERALKKREKEEVKKRLRFLKKAEHEGRRKVLDEMMPLILRHFGKHGLSVGWYAKEALKGSSRSWRFLVELHKLAIECERNGRLGTVKDFSELFDLTYYSGSQES